MRAVFRELAVTVTVVVLVLALVVGGVIAWVLVEAHQAEWLGTVGTLPTWAVGVGVVLGTSVVALSGLAVARSLADRSAETVADPLRRLAHRTDEMASGGFALDPQARPGRLVELEPWRGGIREIDAVAREVDRHHSTFARALVSERSFAADASHQLRTPLSALLLRLEEIAQADDASLARAEAEIAISQVERLSGVVDELLRRTRPGHASGGALSAVDAVLAGLDEEWGPAFAEAGRRIRLTCERGVIVEASASALSQVLNTLVENALVHGAGDVALHVARSGPSAVFTVRDEGPGIPAQLARVIFERAVTTGRGTGLGLAVARETAESVGGRLELTRTSPPVFAVYLPLADTP
ncbi:sensor histidine kinase [Ornithinimicrobium cerasi]|uniref:histidine kinase n=1 Tax=Ornithinimicrobium cerasi TaxID=2248773 RepID=A0A285VH52_9MICO|nr:HAMP domain-containing sensor histidine kinase [Ornithinimicrobium cerasi]SOC52506.1 Signal transduction histidine kinase [Ornithinimicrobium cerasi]